MCARRLTSAMPKPIFWCEQAFCRSMVVMSCALRWCALMSWGRLRDWDEVMWLVVRWPVGVTILDSTLLFSFSSILFYPLLHSVFPVLCSTLLRSTLLYYSLLYSSLLFSTSLYTRLCSSLLFSALLCSALLFYPLLFSSLLLSTLLISTLLFSSLLFSTLLDFTKYCACHEKSLSWLILLTFETSFTMRGATGVTPTSPNTAPATENHSHDWSSSHLKRHSQCGEQQESPSNFTKYCACHEKSLSWLILFTFETSFTMRRATRVTLQLDQILCLPRKITLMIDPLHIWNVIYNAQTNESYSNFTKHCACHEKWLSWLILVTYETSSTMRRATGVILQLHQILHLPRKMTVMIDRCVAWNVQYNARSIRSHTPTSPNTAPATKF